MTLKTLLIVILISFLAISCAETDGYKEFNQEEESWFNMNMRNSREFIIENKMFSLSGPYYFETGIGQGDPYNAKLYFNDNWIVLDEGFIEFEKGKQRSLDKYKINRVLTDSKIGGFQIFEFEVVADYGETNFIQNVAIVQGGDNYWRFEKWGEATISYNYMREVY